MLKVSITTYDGIARRDLLQVGTLGAIGFSLANLATSNRKLAGQERPDKSIEVAYLNSFSRYRTNTEKEKILRVLADARKDERRQIIEDMYRALLSGKEFLFNH